MVQKMKFLDLFAGIGGFRLGMESAGHECIGFCEIDKFARKSYKAIHDTKGEIELHDITTVSDDTIRGIGHVDVICGGFPCQAFSIAGARRGFEDTRGNLEPKIIQRGHGYNKGGEHDIAPTLTRNSYHENNVLKITEATSQGYAEAEVGDSVNLSHPNSKTRRGRVGKKIANTLLTGESQGVVEPDFRIRKLTPRECWRLQGFPDWAFDKAQEVNSNSQLYKQAGNSVTVNVISAIAQGLGGN